ncbi:MAG: ABC transporter substrate-binding protein [Bacillati bacterium ANGP1]|uniref:ABC transporter substrate-binding protein n=1 Tax=Candidatus Segetimicrobium genomatis TaxID=2569760 RepID=A0A537IQL0_9BACT|nr:MAG: ABC transporter substrate-binding protein [Terrabacteria group bacterium ANGP1]
MIRRQLRDTLFVLLTAALGIALPGWAAPSGGTLRVGIDVDAGTLDPRLANDTTARRVIEQVYDGLIELDPQLRPRPALAESWTQLTPTVWVFKLRQNIHFHDGTPLTAADVVFTYSTILDPGLRAPLRGLYTPISRVEAVDNETVRFTLSAPYAPLLKYADMGIVSKAAVERLGADYATRPLGTGPYKFVSWQRNSRIVLEANPEYWKGQPRLSQVVFNIIPDNTTRAAALESGDVDLIHSPLSPQDVARLRSAPRVSVTEMTGLGITYLNMNTVDSIVRDVRIRRALASLCARSIARWTSLPPRSSCRPGPGSSPTRSSSPATISPEPKRCSQRRGGPTRTAMACWTRTDSHSLWSSAPTAKIQTASRSSSCW